MSQNIAPSLLESTLKKLADAVFPNCGKVMSQAVGLLLGAITRTGSPLVQSLAETISEGSTSKKGRQERISGWLARYDFARPIQTWLWSAAKATIRRDTVIAIDGGDLSKEFGGKGMEGMERGYDASRGVVAMGHNLLAAAVVNAPRARALHVQLLKGRKGLFQAERALLSRIDAATKGDGIVACDRGFDNQKFISHATGLSIRTVVRVKDTDRDVFATGRSIPSELASVPGCSAILQSPTRRQKAVIRWKEGLFPASAGAIPRSWSSPAPSTGTPFTSTASASVRSPRPKSSERPP